MSGILGETLKMTEPSSPDNTRFKGGSYTTFAYNSLESLLLCFANNVVSATYLIGRINYIADW